MDPATQQQSGENPQSTAPNHPKPERPALNTPISTPTAAERPVGTWAPAADVQTEPEPAQAPPQTLNQNLQPMISSSPAEQVPPEQQAQQVGQEVTELSIPVLNPTDSSQDLNLTGQTHFLEQDPALDSNSQTNQLPQELFAAQNPNNLQALQPKPESKSKKIILSIFGILVFLSLMLGTYILFFGNKAASEYKENSGITTYQEAFGQINQSLQKSPADKATLEAGINKLKIAENNQKALAGVFLGTLNPNYKQAKQLGVVIGEYRTNTKAFQEQYAFPNFLTALSDSDQVFAELTKLNQTDFNSVAAETFSQNLTTATNNCKQLITNLKESAKPADLSTPTDSFANAIRDICNQLPSTIQAIIEGKSGLLSSGDQESIKRVLTAANNNISSIINGSSISSFYINQLTSYTRSAKEESARLQKEAESIITN